jgi:type II secretory pathway component PulC
VARVTCLIGLLVLSCGGSAQEAEAPPKAPPPAPAPQASAKPPAAPPGTLLRKDVVGFINGGIARFLQMVEVEPSLENGKFKGWNLVALQPPEFWQNVDLKPGDIVTSVNGMPIERETEAYDAFQAVRGAEKLSVSYLRAGKPRLLEYRILDKQ